MYIGEKGRTLEKRLSEHRTSVKKNDLKNEIAVMLEQTSTRSTGGQPQSGRRKEATGEGS